MDVDKETVKRWEGKLDSANQKLDQLLANGGPKCEGAPLAEVPESSGSKRRLAADSSGQDLAGAASAGKRPRTRGETTESDDQKWQVGSPPNAGTLETLPKRYTRDVPDYDNNTKPRQVDLLIQTVNDVEFDTALKTLEPWNHKRSYFTSAQGGVTVYYGFLGKVKAAVVRTGQGSRGQTGSANQTRILLGLLKPRAVVLVGVCFGTPASIYPEKANGTLRMGDVLVGSRLLQYDHSTERADDGGGKEDRNIRSYIYQLPEALTKSLDELAKDYSRRNKDRWILDTLEARAMMEKNGIPAEATKVHVGDLMCGSKLVDDPNFHRELVARACERGVHPLGGEMEGYGAYEAQTHEDEIPCIVIKGICDWAVVKGKDFQPHAAVAAFSFLSSIADRLVEQILPRAPGRKQYHVLDEPITATDKTKEMFDLAHAVRKALDEEKAAKMADEYLEAQEKVADLEKQLKVAKKTRDEHLKKAKGKVEKASTALEDAWRSDVITNHLKFEDGVSLVRTMSGSVKFTRGLVTRHVPGSVVVEMERTFFVDNPKKVEFRIKPAAKSSAVLDNADDSNDDSE